MRIYYKNTGAKNLYPVCTKDTVIAEAKTIPIAITTFQYLLFKRNLFFTLTEKIISAQKPNKDNAVTNIERYEALTKANPIIKPLAGVSLIRKKEVIKSKIINNINSLATQKLKL